MGREAETVCVTGAAGYIGSWLVKRLLEAGYTVRATVRDPDNVKKVKHLLELPNAKTHLSLWKADLAVEGSFDEAIRGSNGVFHVASVIAFESKDPENEVINPTINGVLSILKASANAKTVRRVVFTSSAATVGFRKQQQSEYDETHWSDLEFIQSEKIIGWMYFVAKTLAEQAALNYAKVNYIDFISILPTLVVGPFLIPSLPTSLTTALSPVTGNEFHQNLIKQGQFVHLDDLCSAHIFVFENPEAQGRYICSSHEATILELAKILKQKYPEYNIPTKFKDVDENVKNIVYSSKKIRDLGFQFKYSLEDMFTDAIEASRAKGLLPLSNVDPVVDKN